MNILKKIFEVKNIDNKNKQLTLCGIKIKFKKKQKNTQNGDNLSLRRLNRIIQTNLSTMILHQNTFNKFKNCYNGKEIVIVANGPSAKYYKPKNNVIHIGVNRAYIIDNIDFQYMFFQDYSAMPEEFIEGLVKYKPDTCQKFFGLTMEYDPTGKRVVPESYAIRANALRYRTDWAGVPSFIPQFAYDISTCPLGCFGTIVFPALQFALWTNPKRIYLVGCDCTNDGYFNSNEKNLDFNTDKIKIAYQKFKQFSSVYYPETEIVSINPIGLKGYFTDEYTEEYLAEQNI